MTAQNLEPGLELAVSPYLIGPVDPAAVAALVLGTRVVTLMPTPPGFSGGASGRSAIRAAVEACPRYLRLLESWRWTMPLWNLGVLRASLGSATPEDEVRPIAARGNESDVRLLHAPALVSDEGYLDAVASDLLKGGADPGVSTCLSAALDRFALERGLISVRAGLGVEGGSVAQRIEASLARKVGAVAIPMPVRASAAWLLALRRDLAGPLDELRRELRAACQAGAALEISTGAGLARAGSSYAAAFERWRRDFAPEHADDDEDRRVADALVAISVVRLPGDVSLRSSVFAMRRAGLAGALSVQDVPGGAGGVLAGLSVRRMAVRPAAGAGAPQVVERAQAPRTRRRA